MYNKIGEWLCSWRADRWMHLLVALIVCFAVSKIAMACGVDKGGAAATAVAVGLVMIVAKECLDSQGGSGFDVYDLLFGAIGIAAGLVMAAV